jgi:diaminopimelate epimerase
MEEWCLSMQHFIKLSHNDVAPRRMRCRLYDAAGNRILWLDSRGGSESLEYDELKELGFELSRQFQVGQDLTAVLFGSPEAQLALFWNPDGSYEMICGNAIRCLAHFVSEDSSAPAAVAVQTEHGKYLSRKVDANHGSVVVASRTVRVGDPRADGDRFVDVGTPHRIRVVEREWPEEDVAAAMFYSTGAAPVNFSLVRRAGPRHYRARIFERGVGETSSCGTASVAIVAALEKSAAHAAWPRSSQHVEFASGEQLTVSYDSSQESYEIGGRVALLQEF